MTQNVLILQTSEKGKYLFMVPNLEQGRFASTNQLIGGKDFYPFDFQRHYLGNTINYPDNLKETKEKMRIEAFKKFIDFLNEEANRLLIEFPSILVEITQNQDAGNYWCLTANYLFMFRT